MPVEEASPPLLIAITPAEAGELVLELRPWSTPVAELRWQYRQRGLENDWVWSDWQDIPDSDASTRSYRLTGLGSNAAFHPYYFQVRARVGKRVGPASDTVIGIPAAIDERGIATMYPYQIIEGAGTWRLAGGSTVIDVPAGGWFRQLAGGQAIVADPGTVPLEHLETGSQLFVNVDTAEEVGRYVPRDATPEATRTVNALFDQIVSSARLDPGQTAIPSEPPPGRYIAVAGDQLRGCALNEQGEALCWSASWYYRSQRGRLDPPPGLYSEISVAGSHACAVAAGSGEIICWGGLRYWVEDEDGVEYYGLDQLNDPPPGRYTTVSTSGSHVCALTVEGEAVCWGRLGGNTVPDFLQFKSPGPYVAISANYLSGKYGFGSSCGLTAEGEVICWDPYSAKSGHRFAGPYTHVATRAPAGFCAVTPEGKAECIRFQELEPFAEAFAASLRNEEAVRYAAIAASETHVCALTAEGRAVCGAEEDKHGYGASSLMGPPDPSPSRYVAIDVGYFSACALTDAGEVVCWGSEANKITPPDPPPGRYVAVSDGYGHTCALVEDGEVVCWGWNNFGQADVPDGRYLAISAGAFHTCALTEAGEARCWGGPDFHAAAPPPGRLAAISIGDLSLCALTVDGAIACSEGTAAPPPGRYTALSVGGRGACAIAESGELACWGEPARELPAEFLRGRYTAVSVGGGHEFDVDPGPGYACALSTEGDVRCWGWRGEAPLPDPPPDRFVMVAAGDRHACALTKDGEAVCWGGTGDWPNDQGPANSPPGRYTTISASSSRTCAISDAGEVVCWGETEYLWPPFLLLY